MSPDSGPKDRTTRVCFLVICSTLVICAGAIVITVVYRKKCQAVEEDSEMNELNDMYGQYEFEEADGQVVKLGSVWVKDKS